MAAILCLSIHCGVPVTVVEYYSVSACQVHPYTPTARRQNEAENTLIGIEPLHESLTERREGAQRVNTETQATSLQIHRTARQHSPVSVQHGCCHLGEGRCVRGS